MPAKKGLPAPIDRPLSRAYLRKFTGWSTAFPPGVSEPTSLRIMENLLINREGSVRIRPGLRMLTRYLSVQPMHDIPMPSEYSLRGTHETFYLNDGRKAYLMAVHSALTDLVEFRVATRPVGSDGSQLQVYDLAHADIGFTFDSAWAATNGPWFTNATTYVKYVQIDNKILALSNAGEELIVFQVGETKKVLKVGAIHHPEDPPPVAPGNAVIHKNWIEGPQTGYPSYAQLPMPNALWSNDGNPYNYGFFYTYSSLLGESEASKVTTAELKRPFGAWSWWPPKAPETAYPELEAPQPDLEAAVVSDPTKASDQLLVGVGSSAGEQAEFAAAVAAGATSINFYMFSWSKQSSVPTEAILIGTKPLTPASTWVTSSFIVMNPATGSMGHTVPVPNQINRYNSTKPSRAGQGLVAADRLILVNDPTAAGVIRWTTNEQGNYLNFSPGRGGGYKTLTSGNMQVPACAKLWQNPQSADTITVLCMGTDGHSTSYYMAPAQVASQSDAVNIMGFEETTATPGTTSPYGVEVANNALYHPLDDQLMKSTASNYNINHKSQTDKIANMWRQLADKHHIVSCYHDQRLYYLVHNPDGAELEPGCWGNEVWVMDMSAEGGAWSRWTTQGISLRKVEVQGKVMMSLAKPDGLYAFDEDLFYDDYAEPDGLVQQRPIGWKLETNTQGANRAHDAWAHLQQLSLVMGNFYGSVRWGVRGWDLNGREVDISKVTHVSDAPEIVTGGLPHDIEDQLLVRRDMKEWFFYAHSEPDEFGQPLVSAGQVNVVQYRYTPVSVNVGYEHGSVETFEYGRDALHGAPVNFQTAVSGNTVNGVPIGANDQGRP